MFDLNNNIVTVFCFWVKDRADHPAVIEGETVLTYKDLYESAKEIAGRLASLGIGKGDVVPVVGRRDTCIIKEMLGVLMTGAAFSLVDEAYPEERKESIFSQTNARFLLKDKAILDLSGRVMETAAAEGFDIPEISADDPAYVHFTSGTEGAPKGVKVQHRGSVQRINWAISKIGNNGDNVMLIKTKLSFIASIDEITSSFMTGSTMVILPEPLEKEPARIVQAIYDHKVTWMIMAPTMLTFVIKEAENSGKDMLGSLRLVQSVGEALKPAVAGTILKALKNTRLVNCYGMTESACILAAWHEVTEDDVNNNCIPLGRAPEGSALYVIADGKFCREGEPGEICVGGLGVSLGYLNEELTKKAFVLHEFEDGREPELLFHAGDRGQWRSDGELIGLGRSDSQVKIHGQRVELGEVENAVAALPDVKECTVRGVKNKKDDTSICAYIVTNSGEGSAAAFREALSEKLPDYMIPAHFVFMDELPRNVNGKVDKTKLPVPRTERSTEYIAPRNELEAKICAAFEEALEEENVGIKDSFYELGGDSLAAISLSTILESSVGKEEMAGVHVNELIRAQTPEGIAEIMSGKKKMLRGAPFGTVPAAVYTKEQFDLALSTRDPGNGRGIPVETTISNRIMIRRQTNVVKMKFVFDRSVSIDRARSTVSQVLKNTVYEYAYDDSLKCFLQHPGTRDEIAVFDFTEDEADNILLALEDAVFPYDGSRLLSTVYMIESDRTGEAMLYIEIHHSINDRESSSILEDALNNMLLGREAFSDHRVMTETSGGNKETVSKTEYFDLVKELNSRIKDHPYTRVAVGRILDPECFIDPIPVIMDMYLEMNPLLSDMKKVPVDVIVSGRNAENMYKLGCYLTIRYSVYDTETKTLSEAPEILPEADVEEATEWVPQINYIGIFPDVRPREEIFRIQKGYEKAKYLHGSRIDNELVLKLPIYE